MKRPRIALWIKWRYSGTNWIGYRPKCPNWLWRWAVRRVDRWHEDPKCGTFDHLTVNESFGWKPFK